VRNTPTGLAALHQQGLVVLQLLQRREDRLEAVPVARRLADAAVDDERVRVLGDLGIEVVLDHPERGLDLPVGTGELRAARRAHRARLGESVKGRQVGHGGSRDLG
jgi:hypothetical protein